MCHSPQLLIDYSCQMTMPDQTWMKPYESWLPTEPEDLQAGIQAGRQAGRYAGRQGNTLMFDR